jgi:hypothetical protein
MRERQVVEHLREDAIAAALGEQAVVWNADREAVVLRRGRRP